MIDFHLERVLKMINQSILKLSQDVTALQSTMLTTTAGDLRYAPITSNTLATSSLNIIDTQPQDISPAPVTASTDLTDSATLARLGSANIFTANQTLTKSDPTLVFNHTGASPRSWHLQATVDGLNIYDITGTQIVMGFPAGKKSFAIPDGIAAPAVVAGFAQIYVDTADGDLKIIFGDGTVKTIVAD